jgi:cell division protein FtsZ
MEGAKGLLFSISGGRDLKMAEIHDIAKAVSANLDTGARVIFGAYYERGLSEKSIKVTVIATGFSGNWSSGNRLPFSPLLGKEEPAIAPTRTKREGTVPQKAKPEERTGEVLEAPTLELPTKEESWDIPAFLRKKKRR